MNGKLILTMSSVCIVFCFVLSSYTYLQILSVIKYCSHVHLWTLMHPPNLPTVTQQRSDSSTETRNMILLLLKLQFPFLQSHILLSNKVHLPCWLLCRQSIQDGATSGETWPESASLCFDGRGVWHASHRHPGIGVADVTQTQNHRQAQALCRCCRTGQGFGMVSVYSMLCNPVCCSDLVLQWYIYV